ncbi:di/tricarboxylate transporter [Salibacterium salarium]|uniref:SLC13 family permease n=1 Tax=Salibacterium salarium TaxID=284579 RepID=UPI00277FD8BF|nr:SLC13 family permease [Salibacterium salarium]MDQ0298077.1 di/tricarboxylate transporter [Salibacterium salarium]
MTVEIIIVLISISIMMAGLFFEIARPDLMVFFTLFMFLMFGFVSPDEALAGFSNQGMMTVALLFVVAGVFEKSGLIERLVTSFLTNTKSGRSALLKLLFPVSAFSAFFNNTPIVAALTPVVRRWTSKHDISPSRYLLPLSYASILGGTITLIGTSTNLVIHGLLIDAGEAGFSFFQLAWVGIPLTIIGLIYIFTCGPVLLPDHRSMIQRVSDNTKDYLSEMMVTDEFAYVNHSVEEAQLRNLKGVYLIEIIRGRERISPVSSRTLVQAGDRLVFTGMISTIADLQKRKGLEVNTGTDLSMENIRNGDSRLVEVVISHQSFLTQQTIKQSRFREIYDAAVVAVHRNDERVEGKVGDIVPKAGDLLLLVTGPDFNERIQERKDFYITSPTDERKFYEDESKGWFTLWLLLGMILMVMFGWLSIFKAMVITVGVLLVAKIVTPNQAKDSVQFQVLLLIASALGIGNVIRQTGTADWVAHGLIDGLAPLGVVAVLVTIYLLTNVFTEFITNNAAAVIMFPIGYEIALDMGIDPIGMAVLVAIAASASFLSPIGYQTNLIVFGPGGYSFGDYARIGFPLTMICMITTVSIVYFLYV